MASSEIRANVVVALVSLLVSIVAIEAVLQAVCRIPKRGYGTWSAYPGSEIEMVSRPDAKRAIHRYNNFGFRGADFEIEPNKPRIVAVGDSFTEGVGVEEEATWPAVLSQLLRVDSDVEVLNLGDRGASPERYAEIVAKVGIALRPRHLIVCFITSDLRFGPQLPEDPTVRTVLSDPFRDDRSRWLRPVVLVAPGITFLIERLQGKWPLQEGRGWRDHERILEAAVERVARLERIEPDEARALVFRRLSQIDPEIIAASRDREFNPALLRLALSGESWNYRVKSTDMNVPVELLDRRTREWLTWFAGATKSHGVEPWIVYFPQAALVARGPWGLFLDDEFDRPDVFRDTSVRDLLRDHSQALDIGFVDLTSPLMAGSERERLFLRYDTHPNVAGHRTAARAIAEAIHDRL